MGVFVYICPSSEKKLFEISLTKMKGNKTEQRDLRGDQIGISEVLIVLGEPLLYQQSSKNSFLCILSGSPQWRLINIGLFIIFPEMI